MTANPYQASLGDRDTLAALADTPERIRTLVGTMKTAQFDRSHAPGKWSVGRVLIHLAHTELAFSMRVRQALSTADYVVQPFDQDAWVAREPLVDADTSFRAYYGLRQWNLPLFRSLTADERARPFTHPERGEISIDWILSVLAGHELHHLRQLEEVVRASHQ